MGELVLCLALCGDGDWEPGHSLWDEIWLEGWAPFWLGLGIILGWTLRHYVNEWKGHHQ